MSIKVEVDKRDCAESSLVELVKALARQQAWEDHLREIATDTPRSNSTAAPRKSVRP